MAPHAYHKGPNFSRTSIGGRWDGVRPRRAAGLPAEVITAPGAAPRPHRPPFALETPHLHAPDCMPLPSCCLPPLPTFPPWPPTREPSSLGLQVLLWERLSGSMVCRVLLGLASGRRRRGRPAAGSPGRPRSAAGRGSEGRRRSLLLKEETVAALLPGCCSSREGLRAASAPRTPPPRQRRGRAGPSGPSTQAHSTGCRRQGGVRRCRRTLHPWRPAPPAAPPPEKSSPGSARANFPILFSASRSSRPRGDQYRKGRLWASQTWSFLVGQWKKSSLGSARARFPNF